MKKTVLILSLIVLGNISSAQTSMPIEEGKFLYYRHSTGLVGSLLQPVSVGKMTNVDKENHSFSINVATNTSNTTNISYKIKENTFSPYSHHEYGLIDSVGFLFSSYGWEAIYISKVDKLILFWTNQHSGEVKPEHIDPRFILGTDKDEMKKYKLEKEYIQKYVADAKNKLDKNIPILKAKKEKEDNEAQQAVIDNHYQDELAASKTRTLPEWAIEKGFELKVCKDYWKDGTVLQTWVSENSRGWGVTKDEYNLPLYKTKFILMLIKSKDGNCYFIDNTLKMNYEGGGSYGHIYLMWKPEYYEEEWHWKSKRMVECGKIK